ncbi:MAG: hypothetical protein VB034_12825 [Eubacteriales bacterium]|nr:hypothetical protein [Eubacteriales bacterium]
MEEADTTKTAQMEHCFYEGTGFQPVSSFKEWQIAYLNDTSILRHGAVNYMERHFETDEAFILQNGSAILYLGGGAEEPRTITAVKMLRGHVYQVRQNIWHNVALFSGTSLLLVEQKGTGMGNSELFSLPPTRLIEVEDCPAII